MELFLQNHALLTIFFVAVVLLSITSAFSYRFQSGGLFLALTSIVVGGIAWAIYIYQIPSSAIFPFFAWFCMIAGGNYLLVFCAMRFRERRRRKKETREIEARKLQYTLPQKDNTFIRTRLHTSLQETPMVPVQDTEDEEIKLRFTYAKKLLTKLRTVEIGAVERLEIDELTHVFALFEKKENYVGEDVRLISEAFSRVLKLSAKYGV